MTDMYSRPKSAYLPAFFTISLFIIYLSTICPTVYLGDSGELTAAAFSLGIPHNSGYPLYSLLGKLFCLIPLGNIGFRMNLMSSFFAALTVWLVYSFIFRLTSSGLSSFVGASALALSPLLWSQAVLAEVYTLHAFFVVLLVRLILEWDEKREFVYLILITFITGISFCNHLQTVMLAPGVLFIILSGDKGAVFKPRHLIILAIFFLIAISLYLYLPIRTDAGAAIHWGDPNNLKRFLAHVTGGSHREAYVLNMSPLEYLLRAKEILLLVKSQFGILLIFAFWGWLRLGSIRWKIFFLTVILFDLAYALFLNTISLKYTAFTIPACIMLAILSGVGIAHLIKAIEEFQGIGKITTGAVKALFFSAPCILLFFGFGLHNQSRNYAAYEHMLNIFRSLERGNILFLHGDNNLFPVIYGRIAEGVGENVILYDMHNIIFKMPYLGDSLSYFPGSWEELRGILEKHIIEKKLSQGISYAVFDPNLLSLPNQYKLVPYGMLYRVAERTKMNNPNWDNHLWKSYSEESFYDHFERDYFNRQLCAHFYFRKGRHLFRTGRTVRGLNYIRDAFRIAYDDIDLHSIVAIFFINQGLFKEAYQELEKASIYSEDMSAVYNTYGYYYDKLGDFEKAIFYFRRAIELNPGKYVFYNDLGLVLREAGKEYESSLAFKKSLSINRNQPEIENFIND